ncbi:MAG: enoyl-CoA hydratase/isomerase family protein [Chloroflexi bacterium]|nr:enoyl-CoA hydratase/isomerase family protein [Chloroflexota bacterium]
MDLQFEKNDHVGVITLNRPDKLNALTGNMIEEWVRALESAQKDEDVRVVVVTGAGRAFCSGMDVSELKPDPRSLAERRNSMREGVQRVPRAVAALEKPYIASVRGPAFGGGMDLVTMTDIRIAAESARFSMSYANMGLTPGNGGCFYLPQVIGFARAAELIWTARVMDAQEALRIGYVSRVVKDEDLWPETMKLAGQIANSPPIATQLAKRLMRRCRLLDENAVLEAHEYAILIAGSSQDAVEGPTAWREKRPPHFQGK